MYFEEDQTTVVWAHDADVVWTVDWARVGAKRSNAVFGLISHGKILCSNVIWNMEVKTMLKVQCKNT